MVNHARARGNGAAAGRTMTVTFTQAGTAQDDGPTRTALTDFWTFDHAVNLKKNRIDTRSRTGTARPT